MKFVSLCCTFGMFDRNLRKANCKVRVAHAIPALVLHDAVEMEDQGAKRGVIGIGQVVDLLMQGVAPGTFVFDPGGVDESIVSPAGEQRLGKIAEELFQQSGDRVHIVVEVCRVAEVEVGRVVVESVAQGVDVRGCAGQPVDAFDVEAEEVDGLHALVDDHGDGGLVAGEELFEVDAEDWAGGRFA